MYRILLLVLLLNFNAWPLTTVTGTFQYPDGSPLNGRVVVRLTRSTVTNMCVTPAQVMSFQPVTIRVTGGVLGTLSLYATSCLSPSIFYLVNVFDQNNQLLYSDHWNVPNVGSVDVTQIGVGH